MPIPHNDSEAMGLHESMDPMDLECVSKSIEKSDEVKWNSENSEASGKFILLLNV